jgi:hypothetical protein
LYSIGKALDKALEQSCELFKKHGRHSARKVLIVFTNGKSSARANELKKHAQALNELNTKLIVVAIGDDVSVEELLEVTSSEESIVRTQPEDDHQELFASIVRFSIEGTYRRSSFNSILHFTRPQVCTTMYHRVNK